MPLRCLALVLGLPLGALLWRVRSRTYFLNSLPHELFAITVILPSLSLSLTTRSWTVGPSFNSSVHRPFVSACVMCLLLGLPSLSIAALSRRSIAQLCGSVHAEPVKAWLFICLLLRSWGPVNVQLRALDNAFPSICVSITSTVSLFSASFCLVLILLPCLCTHSVVLMMAGSRWSLTRSEMLLYPISTSGRYIAQVPWL